MPRTGSLSTPAFTAALITATLLVFPARLSAQVDPNLERGFAPEKPTTLGQIDSVNLFNGSLTLAIPIGQTYHVNGGLSYRFMLVYNSTVWDISTASAKGPTASGVDPRRALTVMPTPGWAGFSPSASSTLERRWAISPTKYTLRRPRRRPALLLHHAPQRDLAGPGRPVVANYSTPAMVRICALHASRTAWTTTSRRRTGRYAASTAPPRRLPSPFELQYIADRFGNQVTVNTSGNPWVISDGYRTHKVHFTTVGGTSVVKYVALAAFGDSNGAPSAWYTFHYGYGATGVDEPTTIEENCRDNDPMTGTAEHGDIEVPLLTAVDLVGDPPIGGSFRMPAYYTACSYTPPGGSAETIPDLPGVLGKTDSSDPGPVRVDVPDLHFSGPIGRFGGGNLTLNETAGVRTKRALTYNGTCVEATPALGRTRRCRWSRSER